MPWILLSLFLTSPAPLDMPRAEAYLVEENGVKRLEDRYDKLDLWMTQAVIGRWTDDDGRVFVLSSLDVEPPSVEEHATLSRTDWRAERVTMKRIRANRALPPAFRRAISLLAPCALAEERPRRARQLPHGYRDVDYWQHPTNYTSVVCAFRREKSEKWHLAFWKLAEGDDYAECVAAFEDRFLKEEFPQFAARLEDGRRKTADARQERELLRADARHSVAAYSNWHVTDAKEFVILDDLPGRGFVDSLTNALVCLRTGYAAAVPTEIDGSGALSVARIFASRAEYLEALETDGCTNMAWTAAYWSPLRRELVAYLPEKGEAELLRTIRHEAFHQYLSYATSMIPASPWLNEGYAQYFEDGDSTDWGVEFDLTPENLERLAAGLPGIFGMDYDQFYDGTDFARRLNYRLAWSVAVFLEKGADKVRFRPFAKLKHDYFESLFRTRDMRQASSAAFGNDDTLRLFVREWKEFWLNR